MGNPVATLQRTAAEYKAMDQKDKRRFWSDGILNNALYITCGLIRKYFEKLNY